MISAAAPSVPVEIVGLGEVPDAGDEFFAVADERMARELVEQRRTEEKEAEAQAVRRVSLDSLFDYIKEGEIKDLNIIVKADVRAPARPSRRLWRSFQTARSACGSSIPPWARINESDVMLASASNAIIVGFNVRPSAEVVENAKLQKVDIRLYRVIYDCLEEMEAAMRGMLTPKFRENVLGHAEVRQVFKVSGVGTVAGCYVKDGKIQRASQVRLVRDGVVVFEGEIASLKRFKDDAGRSPRASNAASASKSSTTSSSAT